MVLLVFALTAYAFDYGTTIINRDLMPYLEVNVAWQYGGWPAYIVLNAALLYLAWYWYRRGSPLTRYQITWFIVWIIFMKISIGISNIQVYQDPPSVESVQHVTQAARTSWAFTKYFVSFLVLYLISFFTYLFWERDHVVIKKS